MRELTAADANAFLASTTCVWHQRFALAPGVWTPGQHQIEWLMEHCRLPADLNGRSVLDVGTCNGAVAFEAERRGAARVVAVDVVPEEWFGFGALRDLLRSRAEFRRCSVYEMPQALRGERFDLVVFWGVLYHLRHPLLGLDAVRAVCDGEVNLETEIAGDCGSDGAWARFYRRNELGGDASNWFTPTAACLVDWLRSSGFEPGPLATWPDPIPSRAHLIARPGAGEPEYARISPERPLRCQVDPSG